MEFLQKDRFYSERFDKVWTWRQWAAENNIKEKLGTKHDLGIDIVAREKTGELCAIQAKCHDDSTVLDKGPVDSFIAAGKTYHMSNYLLACTGPINRNANVMLTGVRCNVLTKEHFRNSSIDWSSYPKIKPKRPKKLRDYQQYAMDDVVNGFKKEPRGKLIMACGTGKTLVSLRIAEKLAGKGGIVMYLVPSISLILQSMREWSDNATIPHYYMAVCSDKSVRNEEGSLTELETPASTDPAELSEKLKKTSPDAMNVIFSTYHSIGIVQRSVRKLFDLVLCDEAHRTAGIKGNSKESFLTIVHSDSNIRAKRRLYMTATPRIYTENVKTKAKQKLKEAISMDDKSVYGPEFHNLTFHDAVHKYNALADFKVRIAVMNCDTMDNMTQDSIKDDDSQIKLNEKTLMAAVWHALEYPGTKDEKQLLQRVLVFCDIINSSKLFAGMELNYKKDIREDSEKFEKYKEIDKTRSFIKLVEHVKKIKKEDDDPTIPAVRHVDGGDNAQTRRRELDWLRDSQDDPNTCRMLSNARCLSEGVDVPALDGVVFMNPRKSVVDVVQAVGRVMRRSPGKEYGYVILPVAIPASMKIEDALNDNEHFKVVWQVLNALRSHDPNLAEEINRLILDPPPGTDNEITPRIIIRHAGSHNLNQIHMPADKMIQGIATKLIEKVGDVDYYDKYGQKLGEATHTIEARLKNKIKSNDATRAEIQAFHEGLKSVINDSITEQDAIRIISQHMVLSRVFDGLFAGEFTSHNPISIAFNKVIKKIGLAEELEDLEEFYDDVKKETGLIETREERQSFIKKIYDNFLKSADKKGTEQHGIVHTPIEIIDFIIHSVQHILQTEFSTEFDARSVKILEPFAGTGTFLVRLLESRYLQNNMYEKYKHDLFANEMILLAYYIATINIETTYQSLRRGNRYVPFDGISYTDTLVTDARYKEDKEYRGRVLPFTEQFKVAHERINKQRWTHLHVLLGNPPYSVGQKSFNDQNPNMQYPELDKRIENTYLEKSKVTSKKAFYDSYIRSIRWASDRIGKSGVIAFITNASFLRSDTGAGIRASLAEEFTDVWCFDLRGNQRTQGEVSKKEGGKIFGSGSRAPVVITILVKNPKKKKCTIHYKDIGDYHSREEKLEIVKNLKSMQRIKDWQAITPDRHNDWLDQRSDKFLKYTPIGSKDVKSGKSGASIFILFSMGIGTSRDAWTYNSSKVALTKNMQSHIDYCNKQDLDKPKLDPTHAKWTGDLTYRLQKSKTKFNINKIRTSLYRPFFKQYLYFDHVYNHRPFQIPKIFPEKYSKNLVICIPDKGRTGMFSTLVTDITPDLHIIEQSQCFPLYTYEDNADKKTNITDLSLREYRSHYNDQTITKKSVFYYVYGLLHHPKYKEKFANNLSRELPHIPMAPDFWAFAKVGESLVDLHLNFERCPRYNLGKPKFTPKNFAKLAFGAIKDGKKRKADKTKIRIDGIEIFGNIPEVKYKVNGRTPLEWVVDRYKITIDKESGITNDPCTGTDIIPVIERAVHIGVKSDELVAQLPKEFEPKNWKPKKTGLDVHIDDTTPFQSKL